MKRYKSFAMTFAALALTASLFTGCGKSTVEETASTEAEPSPTLTIGYSDWPGWVAWEVAIQKGFFEEVGVDVKFEWFEYVPSMDAFAAKKLDAVCMTNGDTLVTGATGGMGVMILINDYSNGNDMVVAAPGFESIADLKGKSVGVELGFVSHLLLNNGLKEAGLSESDVTMVNVPTDQTPQTLASGEVSAIVAWQPNSGQALKAVAGSKSIYSSADEPGLIYDVLAVSPESLDKHREEWLKVLKAWYMAVDFIKDPATRDEAIAIMASRVELTPEEYAPFLEGTYLLSLDEAKKIAGSTAEDFSSLMGSTKIVDEFQVANEVYPEPQNLDSYIDMSLLMEL
ncbi:MAG: ABC transporter substrate-binding protein [Kiritimatiellia bacterium]